MSDWSFIRKWSHPAVLVALLSPLLCACTSGNGAMGLELRENGRFDSEWRLYLQLASHKSLAFAGDIEGRYVIGYGFDEVTEEAAKFAAIRDCKMRRSDKRIEDECRTVAVDDELVEESVAGL